MTTRAKREAGQEPTHKLENLTVTKVDLVKHPATGDAFLQLRSADGTRRRPRRAMSSEQYRATFRSNNGNSATIIQGVDPLDSIERRVPDSDASNEDKREAQKERSKKYGIEALENKGENLSYPADYPTKESLYGDPTNLKFPHADADNNIDIGRANNARSRFKQFADTYEKEKSKKIVHTRIVEAQLKAGASPGYDENDPLDKLLPSELVDKMTDGVERHNQQEGEDMSTLEEKVDTLTETVATLVSRMDVAPATTLDPGAPVVPLPTEATVPAPVTPSEPETTDGGDKAPATEATVPAPVTPSEPETTDGGDKAPAATDSTPVVAPVADPAPAVESDGLADSAILERLASAVSGLVTATETLVRNQEAGTVTMTAVNETVSDLAGKVEGLVTRVSDVERGLTTSRVSPADDTEQEGVDRSKGSIFRGVIFGNRG